MSTIPPGRNPTLALAWKLHKQAQKVEGKKSRPAEKVQEQPKTAGPAGAPTPSKNPKPPRATGGKAKKGTR